MSFSEVFESDAEEGRFFQQAKEKLIKKGEISASSDDNGGHTFGDGTTARDVAIMKEAIRLKKRS